MPENRKFRILRINGQDFNATTEKARDFLREHDRMKKKIKRANAWWVKNHPGEEIPRWLPDQPGWPERDRVSYEDWKERNRYVADPTPVEESVIEQDIRERLHEAVLRLSAFEREITISYYWHRMTERQIALRQGVYPSYVHKKLGQEVLEKPEGGGQFHPPIRNRRGV